MKTKVNTCAVKNIKESIVIGGGQSGLACAYYLRRNKVDFTVLDANEFSGGAWQKGWDSLTLFSPSEHSSLPGFQMPSSKGLYPTKDEVIDYLRSYENRYDFDIIRGVEVNNVVKKDGVFQLETNQGTYFAKSVICASGTFRKPFIPKIQGLSNYMGDQYHSSEYQNPNDFLGQHVLVVGEGNSGAQILDELSNTTVTYWAVKSEPQFLPEDVDGRVLFDNATAIYNAKQKGQHLDGAKINLGNIVLVPTVKEARKNGVYDNYNTIEYFKTNSVIWKNGNEENIDAVIWCTGFGYNLGYLKKLISFDDENRPQISKNESEEIDNLFFIGFGGLTGFASATLIGVGRTAKYVAKKIALRSAK
jgi:thioredoxin reductase